MVSAQWKKSFSSCCVLHCRMSKCFHFDQFINREMTRISQQKRNLSIFLYFGCLLNYLLTFVMQSDTMPFFCFLQSKRVTCIIIIIIINVKCHFHCTFIFLTQWTFLHHHNRYDTMVVAAAVVLKYFSFFACSSHYFIIFACDAAALEKYI